MNGGLRTFVFAALIDCLGGSVFAQSQPGPRTYKATGTVLAVDREHKKVTIDADPIEELKLPAMALALTVYYKPIFNKLRKGQRVEVEFVQQGRNYVLTRVK